MAGLARVMGGVLGVMVLAFGLAACGAPAGQHPNDAHPGTVNLEVNSFYIKPSVTTVHTGQITFVAKNQDYVAHEVLVVRVADLTPGDGAAPVASTKGGGPAVFDAIKDRQVAELMASAYDMASARLIEDEIDSLGEVADLAGQSSGTVTLNLPPGQYMLLCNITAHFQSGMNTRLIVTP